MTIQQAKEMDMVEYLSGIGHEPEKISNKSYWYLSPLREEKTPSFKVNRAINRWYDFAEGKGGNLIDFATLYHRCTVSDFLHKLDSSGHVISQHQNVSSESSLKKEASKQISILSAHEVSSYPLIKYLRSRRIADEIAIKYLKEVRHTTGDKTYYALGFKNDAGGYELRNENFKGSSSPKDITFIDNGAKDVAVFEGFFNFLSHRTMFYNQEDPQRNFLILNTAAFFEKTLPKMLEHASVHLYLDNDKTGQKCTQQALNLDNQKFQDERKLYHQYDDLNDWLVHIGQSQKQQLRQKP